MSKVLIVNGNNQYRMMFLDRGWEVVHSIYDADLVQFTGGEDVTPALYGQANTDSYNNPKRDVEEAGYFAIAKRLGKPMAGICRGGQFLNVMCGGGMIQHVDGHCRSHWITIQDNGYLVLVSSTHHQMMVPGNESKLLGYAGELNNPDPEIVLYPKDRCLCFQPHPEFDGYLDCTNLYFQLLTYHIGLH